MPMALPPAARMASTVASVAEGSRSLTTTRAPSRPKASAPARPRPEPAPVMTATRSLRRMAARNSTGRPAAGTPLANKKSRGARSGSPASDASGVDQRRDACRSAAALEAIVARPGAGVETRLGLGRAGLLTVEPGETDRLRACQQCGRVRVEVARRSDGAALVGGRPIVQAALRLVDVGL